MSYQIKKPNCPSTKNALVAEEYKYCRSLVIKHIDSIEKNEIYVVGAVAATAVFGLSSQEKTVAISSAFISLLLAILGFLRYRGIDGALRIVILYIIEVEGSYHNLRYSTFYRERSGRFLRKSRYYVWFSLMALCFLFLIFMILRTNTTNYTVAKPQKSTEILLNCYA